MYVHIKFVLTRSVTVTGHYLSFCEVLMVFSFLSSIEGFLVLTFCHGGPLSTVGFTCALEWLNAIRVTIADPGIILYCLSSIEVLSLGFISLSSESLSDKYLLGLFGFGSFFAIRLLLGMRTYIEGTKSCFNVLFSLYV